MFAANPGEERLAALWRVPHPAEYKRNGGKSREEDGFGDPPGIQSAGETPQGMLGIEIQEQNEVIECVYLNFF